MNQTGNLWNSFRKVEVKDKAALAEEKAQSGGSLGLWRKIKRIWAEIEEEILDEDEMDWVGAP